MEVSFLIKKGKNEKIAYEVKYISSQMLPFFANFM